MLGHKPEQLFVGALSNVCSPCACLLILPSVIVIDTILKLPIVLIRHESRIMDITPQWKGLERVGGKGRAGEGEETMYYRL